MMASKEPLPRLALPNTIPPAAIRRNMHAAIRLRLQQFLGAKVNRDTMVVCGNGPSLLEHIESIRARKRRGQHVVAVAGADNFLLAHNIVPHVVVALDPSPTMADVLSYDPRVEAYFIASRCDPVVFRLLKDAGCNVVLWHADTCADEHKVLAQYPNLPWVLIGGGCSVGLRCLSLGYLLGYRRYHLYGMDSSLEQGRLHAVPAEEDELLLSRTLAVECAGRRFDTIPQLAQQAQDFTALVTGPLKEIDITAHGDGLIPHICRTMRAAGECKRTQ